MSIHNQPTNPMEQSPPWEADSYAARQIPRRLWNPKVHYRVYVLYVHRHTKRRTVFSVGLMPLFLRNFKPLETLVLRVYYEILVTSKRICRFDFNGTAQNK